MLHNCLAATRFQLDNVSVCCEVCIGTRCRGCEWLDRVYLKCHFFHKWHQAVSAGSISPLHRVLQSSLKEPQPNRPSEPKPSIARLMRMASLRVMSSSPSPVLATVPEPSIIRPSRLPLRVALSSSPSPVLATVPEPSIIRPSRLPLRVALSSSPSPVLATAVIPELHTCVQ